MVEFLLNWASFHVNMVIVAYFISISLEFALDIYLMILLINTIILQNKSLICIIVTLVKIMVIKFKNLSKNY